MKRLINPQLLLLVVVLLYLSSGVYAQQPQPADVRQMAPADEPAEPPRQRPSLLQELGLTPEQIQAVRRINQERKPAELAARKRFQEANRALSMAIYTDKVDESEFQEKLSEFQAAQAELARIKFSNELAVRKLLTPDQLVKFRELRRRFANVRENLQNRPQMPSRQPPRRFRRGGPPPVN